MENQATMSDFDSILASRGVTRRSFMKLCAGIAAAAGLSQLAVPRAAALLERYDEAERHLRRAAEAGLREAAENLRAIAGDGNSGRK